MVVSPRRNYFLQLDRSSTLQLRAGIYLFSDLGLLSETVSMHQLKSLQETDRHQCALTDISTELPHTHTFCLTACEMRLLPLTGQAWSPCCTLTT